MVMDEWLRKWKVKSGEEKEIDEENRIKREDKL